MPGNKTTTFGTARAQYHLRQCCVFLNMFPLNRPDVLVPYVQDKVDSGGRLTDVINTGEDKGKAGGSGGRD